MLESRFPRPVGDIGHPDSFPVPTRRLVVGGATPPKIVRDAAALSAHRMADVVVQGVDPAGHFASVVLGDLPAMDPALAVADVVRAAGELRRTAPGLEALVLECTNLPPYAREIERATGLRAWSLLDCQALLRPSSR